VAYVCVVVRGTCVVYVCVCVCVVCVCVCVVVPGGLLLDVVHDGRVVVDLVPVLQSHLSTSVLVLGTLVLHKTTDTNTHKHTHTDRQTDTHMYSQAGQKHYPL